MLRLKLFQEVIEAERLLDIRKREEEEEEDGEEVVCRDGGGVEGIRRLIRQKELVSWDRAN